MIESNFETQQFSIEVMTAWLALYGSAQSSEELSRIIRIYHARLISNLCHGFRSLMSDDKARAAAEGAAAMIDGLWLQYALQGGKPGADRALQLLHDYVDTQLARHGLPQ